MRVADVNLRGAIPGIKFENLTELGQCLGGHSEIEEYKAETVSVGTLRRLQMNGALKARLSRRQVTEALGGETGKVPQFTPRGRQTRSSLCLGQRSGIVARFIEHRAKAEAVLRIAGIQTDCLTERHNCRALPLLKPQCDAEVVVRGSIGGLESDGAVKTFNGFVRTSEDCLQKADFVAQRRILGFSQGGAFKQAERLDGGALRLQSLRLLTKRTRHLCRQLLPRPGTEHSGSGKAEKAHALTVYLAKCEKAGREMRPAFLCHQNSVVLQLRTRT